MNLMHFNMIAVTISCLLLIGGWSARASRWSAAGIFAGIAGLLLVIVVDIHVLLGR